MPLTHDVHDEEQRRGLQDRAAATLRLLSMAFQAAVDKDPGRVYCAGRAAELIVLAERAAGLTDAAGEKQAPDKRSIQGAELALAGLRIACSGAGDLEAEERVALVPACEALRGTLDAWLQGVPGASGLSRIAGALAATADEVLASLRPS